MPYSKSTQKFHANRRRQFMADEMDDAQRSTKIVGIMMLLLLAVAGIGLVAFGIWLR